MVRLDCRDKEEGVEINKIYNEDNLVTCRRMSDGFVDLVVTSPPYDNLRTYNGFSWNFEALVGELYRVVKVGGAQESLF